MPSWKDGEESDDSMGGSLMDMEYFDTPDTIPEPLFCGSVISEDVSKCMLHRTTARKCVAFEGANTGRRFYGCSVQGGMNCGVVEWVDAPWPEILQNCLIRVWDMFYESNQDRAKDKATHNKEVAKLIKENDQVWSEYQKMVDEVTKMFDWQDGVGNVNYQQEHQKSKDAEKLEKEKQDLEMQLQMEKLKLEKEQKCILTAQADIIQNTRKAMKDIQFDRDVLAEEKKELEKVVAELLNAGHGSKEKLEQIKAILEA